MRTLGLGSINFCGDHPLKLFFSVLNLSIIAPGDAPGSALVAALSRCEGRSTGGARDVLETIWRVSGQIQGFHALHWLARQTPKDVPLLLVADRGAANRDGVLVDELAEPRERGVLWVDGAGEPEATRGVLVPDVGDGRGRERGEALKGGVHLQSRALEEDAAAGDEERVARKDRSRDGRGRRGVDHVVTDRVLGVARRRDTPVF
jgi:hypothetical protein